MWPYTPNTLWNKCPRDRTTTADVLECIGVLPRDSRKEQLMPEEEPDHSQESGDLELGDCDHEALSLEETEPTSHCCIAHRVRIPIVHRRAGMHSPWAELDGDSFKSIDISATLRPASATSPKPSGLSNKASKYQSLNQSLIET